MQNPLGRYMSNRGNDLLDIVGVQISLGKGYKLDSHFVFHKLGFAETDVYRFGMDGRQLGLWKETESGTSVFPVYPNMNDNVYHIRRKPIAVTNLLYEECREIPLFCKIDTPRHYDVYSVGAGFHFGIGVDVLVRPYQVMDFIVGLMGLDLASDDALQAPDEPPKPEKEQSESR